MNKIKTVTLLAIPITWQEPKNHVFLKDNNKLNCLCQTKQYFT